MDIQFSGASGIRRIEKRLWREIYLRRERNILSIHIKKSRGSACFCILIFGTFYNMTCLILHTVTCLAAYAIVILSASFICDFLNEEGTHGLVIKLDSHPI